MLSELTVVVTNYQRPELLQRCLSSLIPAGILNVVISSFAPSPEVGGVIQDFLDSAPETMRIDVVTKPVDLGCNELWLQGIYRATTDHIVLLHDDDALAPEFGEVFESLIWSALQDGVGFATWDGQQVAVGGFEGKVIPCPSFQGATRLIGTGTLVKDLQKPSRGSISPGLSVFRREVCIAALKEAAEYFRKPVHFSRPTMLLGNDALLYYRHCGEFETWIYVAQTLTLFGAHEGSESVRDEKRGSVSILAAHAASGRHYKSHPAIQMVPTLPRFIHTYSDYTPKGVEGQRRKNFFEALWSVLYYGGRVLPLPISDAALSRSSKTELADTRATPFLRDVVDAGVRMAGEGDVVLLTNSDTLPVLTIVDRLTSLFSDPLVTSAFCYRKNFDGPVSDIKFDLSKGTKDNGVDLVAVRPRWWRENRLRVPDFVLGCETWDWVVRVLITDSNPGKSVALDDLIYHENHEAFWTKPSVRTSNPGQMYNRRLAQNFFARRVDDQGEYFKNMSPLTKDRRVRVTLPSTDFASGYGRLGDACASALNAVLVKPTDRPEFVLATPIDALKAPVRFTMWEPDDYPRHQCGFMSSESLIVPSSHNKQVFERTGFKGPIRVIPLFGEAPFSEFPDDSVLKFVCVARDNAARSRKGIDDLIEYFQQAFSSGEQDVSLTIKLSAKCFSRSPGDARISVIAQDVSRTEYENLLAQHHCGIFLSGLEAWNFPACEMMACGRPSILIPYGGPAEFTTPQTSWYLPFEMVPAPPEEYYFGVGRGAKASREGVISALREAYQNRSLLLQKAVLSHEMSKQFTRAKFSKRLQEVVQDLLGREIELSESDVL